jgi:hypothetical protein
MKKVKRIRKRKEASNKNHIDGLYTLRDKLIVKKQNEPVRSFVAARPYCGIRIELWEDVIKMIDNILYKMPKIIAITNPEDSEKEWEIGDKFQIESAGIGYEIMAFPTPTRAKGQILVPKLGYVDTCEVDVSNMKQYTPPKKKKKIKKGDRFKWDGKIYKCIAIKGKHKTEVRGRRIKNGKTCQVSMSEVVKLKNK